jgi:hypothetical protein
MSPAEAVHVPSLSGTDWFADSKLLFAPLTNM